MITITIEGPASCGKSHAIAIIGKHLKSLGLDVSIQSQETHNAGTLALSDAELTARLAQEKIILKEMRTAS